MIAEWQTHNHFPIQRHTTNDKYDRILTPKKRNSFNYLSYSSDIAFHYRYSFCNLPGEPIGDALGPPHFLVPLGVGDPAGGRLARPEGAGV